MSENGELQGHQKEQQKVCWHPALQVITITAHPCGDMQLRDDDDEEKGWTFKTAGQGGERL